MRMATRKASATIDSTPKKWLMTRSRRRPEMRLPRIPNATREEPLTAGFSRTIWRVTAPGGAALTTRTGIRGVEFVFDDDEREMRMRTCNLSFYLNNY